MCTNHGVLVYGMVDTIKEDPLSKVLDHLSYFILFLSFKKSFVNSIVKICIENSGYLLWLIFKAQYRILCTINALLKFN